MSLLDIDNFDMTVYALQIVVFSLLPPKHLFSCLSDYVAKWLTKKMIRRAEGFLDSFVQSGGLKIVLALFHKRTNDLMQPSKKAEMCLF